MQHTLDSRQDSSSSNSSDDLLERIRRLESFNRSVSHDLRGPLAGLSGLAQLTRMALSSGDLRGAEQLVAGTARQLSMLIDTVDALLALASAKEVPLALANVSLEDCANEALELVRTSLAHKLAGARMPAVLMAALPRAEADPRLLRQVFANLLCNAAKFSQPVAAPHIELGVAAGDGEATILYVRDNGVGFDAKRAAQLFQPFRRLHGGQFQGSGLGLSIVRCIVERHGGRVWIESEAGVGTTVYFTIAPAPGAARSLAYNRA